MAKAFESLLNASRELSKQLREQGKDAFHEHLKEFFEKNPQVEGIKWQQYTPHFNDGDVCSFGLHGTCAKIKDVNPKYDYGDGYSYVSTYGDYNKADHKGLYDLFKSFEEMLEVLHMAFGDGYEITATRERIEVTAYEHD